ncbi:hypothetical protein SY83_04475 [Paenibacillus swuensis]|uniref:Uncharacterized protein n=1 Tax=Paenibacillus swuensis TaxID=1178515 RepID=A0A172TF56_9BACL|nr:hypothetical protein [Paenibacillus swuensis]ANE45678.1 hypothetical protein SY83_04475 [Paenibacillus swuensis]
MNVLRRTLSSLLLFAIISLLVPLQGIVIGAAAPVQDKPPYIGIRSPYPNKFVTSSVYINAYTADDYSQASLKLYSSDSSTSYFLASSPNGIIQQDISMKGNFGKQTLTFEAYDGKQYTRTLFPIYVDPSLRLKKEQSVVGRILDFNENRILYVNIYGAFTKNRHTGANTPIKIARTILNGKLTPLGCLLQDSTGYMHEYKNGTVLSLRHHGYETLQVKGKYALYKKSVNHTEFYLRDMLTGVVSTVVEKYSGKAELLANGDVLYLDKTTGFMKYSEGKVTLLHKPDETPTGFVYDGVNLMYETVHDTHNFKLYYKKGSNAPILLHTYRFHRRTPHIHYEVHNGWAAYSTAMNNEFQATMINTQGLQKTVINLSNIHQFGTERIHIHDDGQIMVDAGLNHYTSSYNQPVAAKFASSLDNAKYINNKLYGSFADTVLSALASSNSPYVSSSPLGEYTPPIDKIVLKYSGNIVPGPAFEQIEFYKSKEINDVTITTTIRNNELTLQFSKYLLVGSYFGFTIPQRALTDENGTPTDAYAVSQDYYIR